MGLRKTRGDSVLDGDKLTDEQREAVFAFIETHTGKVTQKWLLDEFAIELSEQSISRWAAKMRADKAFAETLSSIRNDAARSELIAKEVGDAREMTESNIAMLSQALFEAQRSNDKKSAKSAALLLSMLIEAVAKDRKSKADVLSAETSRDKFYFDASKAALAIIRDPKAFAALKNEVNAATSESDQIAAVRRRLFGAASQREEAKA